MMHSFQHISVGCAKQFQVIAEKTAPRAVLNWKQFNKAKMSAKRQKSQGNRKGISK